jgi:hypothetical protein
LYLLSITGLAAQGGQYDSLSGTEFSASKRVTCQLYQPHRQKVMPGQKSKYETFLGATLSEGNLHARTEESHGYSGTLPGQTVSRSFLGGVHSAYLSSCSANLSSCCCRVQSLPIFVLLQSLPIFMQGPHQLQQDVTTLEACASLGSISGQ